LLEVFDDKIGHHRYEGCICFADGIYRREDRFFDARTIKIHHLTIALTYLRERHREKKVKNKTLEEKIFFL